MRLTCVFGWMEWLLNFTLKPSPFMESTLNRSVTEAGLVGWACLGNVRVKVISPSFSASQISTKKITTTQLIALASREGWTSNLNQGLAGNQITKPRKMDLPFVAWTPFRPLRFWSKLCTRCEICKPEIPDEHIPNRWESILPSSLSLFRADRKSSMARLWASCSSSHGTSSVECVEWADGSIGCSMALRGYHICNFLLISVPSCWSVR